MIEFRGEYSKACKKFYRVRAGITIGLIYFIICGVFLLGLTYLFHLLNMIWFVIPVAVVIVIVGLILAFNQESLPERIEIDEDILAIELSAAGGLTREHEDVKRVVDWGEWYTVEFYFPHNVKCSWGICG